MVVVDQIRIPLVGFPAQESVEPFEPSPQRPIPLRGRQILLLQRCQMPFADRVGIPAALGQDLRAQCGVLGNPATHFGKSVGEFLDGRHTDRCRIPAGEQRSPGGRTQRGRVELSEPDTPIGDALHIRHLDQTAVAVPGPDSDVVPHQIEDIRRPLRRGRRDVRPPVGTESRISSAILPWNSVDARDSVHLMVGAAFAPHVARTVHRLWPATGRLPTARAEHPAGQGLQ